jgi:hypothetical protein
MLRSPPAGDLDEGDDLLAVWCVLTPTRAKHHLCRPTLTACPTPRRSTWSPLCATRGRAATAGTTGSEHDHDEAERQIEQVLAEIEAARHGRCQGR